MARLLMNDGTVTEGPKAEKLLEELSSLARAAKGEIEDLFDGDLMEWLYENTSFEITDEVMEHLASKGVYQTR